MAKSRSLAFGAFVTCLFTAVAAHAMPMSYGIDVEMLLDNGFGVPAGLYHDAGTALIEVPDAAPAGLSGAVLLDLQVSLGGNTWTLADAADPNFAGVLLDGTPVGLLYFGLNGQGHVLSLSFSPEALAVADITQPDANLFAIGTYELSGSASAVPEPGAMLLFSTGIAVVVAVARKSVAVQHAA